MRAQVRSGKVKEVFEIDDETLEFVFSNRISVFDKVIPSAVPRKGESLCRTAEHWFGRCSEAGIAHHFLERTAPNAMRVRRVRVPLDRRPTPADEMYLIPLEFIARYYVAGSLRDRMERGKVRPEDAGFSAGHVVAYGEPLPEPFLEVTTKLEPVDRPVGREEALAISGLEPAELNTVYETVLRIDRLIAKDAGRGGLIHVDGKKEFALGPERELWVVDTFGTADEDRFWDAQAFAEGRLVELSKERVRQYYRACGYHASLERARVSGLPEPEIPPLPAGEVEAVSELYGAMYERLTGRPF